MPASFFAPTSAQVTWLDTLAVWQWHNHENNDRGHKLVFGVGRGAVGAA
jgi:hypothetical protein